MVSLVGSSGRDIIIEVASYRDYSYMCKLIPLLIHGNGMERLCWKESTPTAIAIRTSIVVAWRSVVGVFAKVEAW